MTLQPWQVPGSASASFAVTSNPVWPGMADIAIASLTPIQSIEFRNGATPAAEWSAEPHETELAFRARIVAALKADGSLTGSRPGVHVLVYQRSGFWGRNMLGKLLPVAA